MDVFAVDSFRVAMAAKALGLATWLLLTAVAGAADSPAQNIFAKSTISNRRSGALTGWVRSLRAGTCTDLSLPSGKAFSWGPNVTCSHYERIRDLWNEPYSCDANYSSNQGLTAMSACCACGGGSTASTVQSLLMEFYNATDGDSWTDSTNWGSSDGSYWYPAHTRLA